MQKFVNSSAEDHEHVAHRGVEVQAGWLAVHDHRVDRIEDRLRRRGSTLP
jgi:hypothetical protein